LDLTQSILEDSSHILVNVAIFGSAKWFGLYYVTFLHIAYWMPYLSFATIFHWREWRKARKSRVWYSEQNEYSLTHTSLNYLHPVEKPRSFIPIGIE